MQQLRRFPFFDQELLVDRGHGSKPQPNSDLESLDITCCAGGRG